MWCCTYGDDQLDSLGIVFQARFLATVLYTGLVCLTIVHDLKWAGCVFSAGADQRRGAGQRDRSTAGRCQCTQKSVKEPAQEEEKEGGWLAGWQQPRLGMGTQGMGGSR